MMETTHDTQSSRWLSGSVATTHSPVARRLDGRAGRVLVELEERDLEHGCAVDNVGGLSGDRANVGDDSPDWVHVGDGRGLACA